MNLTPQAPTVDYPMRMLLYGPPKVGKTVAVSLLPGHYVMELERNGAKYCTLAHDVYLTPETFWTGLKELKRATDEGKGPRFLVIDTVDKLEDLAGQMALNFYQSRFPKAGCASVAELYSLDYGAGWNYLRGQFQIYLDALEELGIPTIFLAHVRTKALEKEARETDVKDISLTSGVAKILCASANLIAFVTRSKAGHLVASTRTSQTVNCGSHLARLAGRDITLVENQSGQLVGHWNEIFPQL